MLSPRSTKRLIMAAIAVLILAYATKLVVVDARRRWQSDGGRAGEAILPGLDINKVERIELSEGERRAVLLKTNGHWVVGDEDGYPVAFEELRFFLRLLQETVIVIPRNVPDDQLHRLELVDPEDAGNGTGVAVELEDATGKRIARIILGKLHKHYNDPDRIDGRYVRIVDSGVVAIVREPFPNAFTSNDAWMDRSFPNTQMAKRFTRSHGGKILWEFVREKPGKPMKGGRGVPTRAQIDQSRIVQLEHAWAHAKFSDVRHTKDVSGWKAGEDEFTFETFEGIVYTFAIGKQTETGWLPVTIKISAAKLAEPNKERSELIRKQADFCSGWLYLLPRTTYAPITRELAYYLVAGKVPQPKPKDEDFENVDP